MGSTCPQVLKRETEGRLLQKHPEAPLVTMQVGAEINVPKRPPHPPLTTPAIPGHSLQPGSPYPLEENEHDITGQGGHVRRLVQSFSRSQLGDEGGHRALSPWGHVPEKGAAVQLGRGGGRRSGLAPGPPYPVPAEGLFCAPAPEAPHCGGSEARHAPQACSAFPTSGPRSPGWQPPRPCHWAPRSQTRL